MKQRTKYLNETERATVTERIVKVNRLRVIIPAVSKLYDVTSGYGRM